MTLQYSTLLPGDLVDYTGTICLIISSVWVVKLKGKSCSDQVWLEADKLHHYYFGALEASSYLCKKL